MTTDNRAPEFQAVLGLFLPLCLITVMLRCYVRIRLVKSFGLDDWFAVITMVKPPFWKTLLVLWSRNVADIVE